MKSFIATDNLRKIHTMENLQMTCFIYVRSHQLIHAKN